ncbi:MAG TPA: ice-binding family protein [Verrucomicrobiae bacterium]|nr:ice-binding family protein [Verrucomicrobiae bacterium]
MKSISVSKNKAPNVWRLIIGLAVAVMFARHDAAAAQAPVALGSDARFAVLAATTVTTIPTTTVNGDLGVSPGNTVTGSPILNGTMHLGDPTAAQAQLDLTTAYNDAAGRTVGAITVAGNLGGQTLTPGLYKSSSSLEISSGDLTLDASGDPNGVWIFQMGSTLITTVSRQVILSGGAQAANIFWQVGSSATIGGGSVFKGTIMADQSITMNTSATLEGRALARNGAVALDANTITIPTATSPAVLQSAAVVTGPYTDSAGQLANLATATITVPMPGSVQFYRIRASSALIITSITISGGNVVIAHN